MVPEVSAAQDPSQVIQQTGFGQRLGLQTSTKLTLMTQEGDRVRFSLDDQFGFSQFGQETQFADSSEGFKFSLSAQAASEFSLYVEGELNEEEFAAIRTLTQRLAPIAQSFFFDDGFDMGQAQEALSGMLGVVQEVKVNLGKFVQASARAHGFLRGSIDNLEALAKDFMAPELPKDIRDLNGLVQSVVNSVFRPLKVEFPENSLIQTFAEFKSFLIEQVVKILNPGLPLESKAGAEGQSENASGQVKEPASSSEVEETVSKIEIKSFDLVVI